MGKIIRREFLGSKLVFHILCLTGIGIPLAIVYLIEGTVTMEEEVEDPSDFPEMFRSRKRQRKSKAKKGAK